MNCEHCGAAITPNEAHEVGVALSNMDYRRRQAVANMLNVVACPTTLCASCFDPILGQVNQIMLRQSKKTD